MSHLRLLKWRERKAGGARGVAVVRMFDTNHIRAVHGQLIGGERRSDNARHSQHFDACKCLLRNHVVSRVCGDILVSMLRRIKRNHKPGALNFPIRSHIRSHVISPALPGIYFARSPVSRTSLAIASICERRIFWYSSAPPGAAT